MYCGLGKVYKAKSRRRKIDNFIKIKISAIQNTWLRNFKDKPQSGIPAEHISDKGPISRIYKHS